MNLEQEKIKYLRQLRLDEKAARTIRSYSGCTNKFISYVGDRKITKEIVIEYKESLLDSGYSKSYINKNIAAVNGFLHHLQLPDFVLKRMKVQQKQIIEDVPTEADVKRMLRMAKQIGQDDTYMIVKTIANTGVRVNELRFFTVENLGRSIEVTNKGKTRVVPIRQELLRELKKYAREHRIKAGSLFPGKKPPAMMDVSTVWKRIQKVGRAAKIRADKLHPHALRHYFAKKYLDTPGNDVTELADILGHERLDTTRIYNRGTIEENRRKIERIKY